jgi:hypothetical protein
MVKRLDYFKSLIEGYRYSANSSNFQLNNFTAAPKDKLAQERLTLSQNNRFNRYFSFVFFVTLIMVLAFVI